MGGSILFSRFFSKNFGLAIFIAVASSIGLIQCSSSSTTSTPGTTTTTVDLTGTATFNSGSPSLSNPLFGKVSLAESAAEEGSTVTLVKIEADGTETTVSTTTTNSSGAFTLADVPVAETDSTDGSDYYYEIQVSDGTSTSSAPVAPETDMAVTVDSSSTLATEILASAVDGTDDNKPVADPDLINNLAEQVSADVAAIFTDNSDLPTSEDTAANVNAFAQGITTAGGNADTMQVVTQLATDFAALAENSESTAANYAAFLQRMNVAVCGTAGLYGEMPAGSGIGGMGTAQVANTTFTPSDIASAYNAIAANVQNTPTVDTATEVASFVSILSDIETAITNGTDVSDGGTNAKIGLLAKALGLSSSSFASTSALNTPQAFLFFVTLPNTSCTFSSAAFEAGVLRYLTNGGAVTAHSIEGVQIYNSSMGQCSAGSDLGTFNATIQTARAGNVTFVDASILSSDTSALISGRANLTCSDGTNSCTYTQLNTSSDCVHLDQEVTYTITVNFSDNTSATATVTRSHPEVQETNVSFNGTTLPNSGTPTAISDILPLFTWTAPDEKLATLATQNPVEGAPTGSKIKYTYEWSYCSVAANCGSPLNGSGCETIGSGAGSFYSVDTFIPTKECDPTACATSNALAVSDVACRLNLQTYLVDTYDSPLGQAAGGFRRYCYDSNGDNDCD